MIPTKLTGAELEDLVVEQCSNYERAHLACIGRYGVQAARTQTDWVIMQSLPDFEGPLASGVHVVFDVKACSQASFSWDKYRSETRGSRSRQLRHMLKRSRFGAKCFFLMHWNERALTKRVVPARTFVLPVQHDFDYWDKVEGGEVKSITIDDCNTLGVEVEWTKQDRGTKYRPDFLPSLLGFGEYYAQALKNERATKADRKLSMLAGFE